MECQPGRQHATVTVAMKRTLLWNVNQVGSMLTCPCNFDTLEPGPLTSSHNLCYPTMFKNTQCIALAYKRNWDDLGVTFNPYHEKTCLRGGGVRPGLTQIGLYSYIR